MYRYMYTRLERVGAPTCKTFYMYVMYRSSSTYYSWQELLPTAIALVDGLHVGLICTKNTGVPVSGTLYKLYGHRKSVLHFQYWKLTVSSANGAHRK